MTSNLLSNPDFDPDDLHWSADSYPLKSFPKLGFHTAKLQSAVFDRGSKGTQLVVATFWIDSESKEVKSYFCVEPTVSDWHLRAFLVRLGYNAVWIEQRHFPRIIKEISADQPLCKIQVKKSDEGFISAELLHRISPPPEPPEPGDLWGELPGSHDRWKNKVDTFI